MMSTRPCAATTRCANSAHDFSFVTSVAGDAAMSAISTVAPSALRHSTMAAPIPFDPPVTTAMRPASELIVCASALLTGQNLKD